MKNKKRTTYKIWIATLEKLRLVSRITGKPTTEILDEMVDEKLTGLLKSKEGK